MIRAASCQCGKLAVAVAGEPAFVTACNRTLCQRRSGAPFSVSARWRREQLVSVAGERVRYERTGASGGSAVLHFCPHCGSTVLTELQALPDFVGVPVGCFADPRFPAPQAAFWCESKAEWAEFPDGTVLTPRQDFPSS